MFIALVVVVTLIITTTSGGSGGPRTPQGSARSGQDQTATTHAATAAASLTATPATRYRGTIVDSRGARHPLDVMVANEGEAFGTLTLARHRLQLLAVDGQTFVKGSRAFWREYGIAGDSINAYARQWVKVSGELAGVDIEKVLAPALLGSQLGQAVKSGQLTVGPLATVNGAQVRRVTTRLGTFSVTVAAPQRVVRVELAPGSASGDNPRAPREIRTPAHDQEFTPAATATISPALFGTAGADDGSLTLDLSDLSVEEIEDLFDRLEDKIRELRTSIDSEVQFALTNEAALGPCGPNSCTARVTIRNSVVSTSPYVKANKPVHALITISMTVDGRPVRTCTLTRRMRPGGATTAMCTARYSLPQATRPGETSFIQAQAHTVAQTLVTADIKRIIKDLKKQKQGSCGIPAGSNSFLAGTRVLMAPGTYLPIERIRPGDRLLAADPVSRRSTSRPVTGRITGEGRKHLVRITLRAAGSGGPGGTVTATNHHPFWVVDEHRWVAAEDLRSGDRLAASGNDTARVVAIESFTRRAEVFNLSVGDPHTYYVRAAGTDVLVHNSAPSWRDKCKWTHKFSEQGSQQLYELAQKDQTGNFVCATLPAPLWVKELCKSFAEDFTRKVKAAGEPRQSFCTVLVVDALRVPFYAFYSERCNDKPYKKPKKRRK